jgi:hypothetical protein
MFLCNRESLWPCGPVANSPFPSATPAWAHVSLLHGPQHTAMLTYRKSTHFLAVCWLHVLPFKY